MQAAHQIIFLESSLFTVALCLGSVLTGLIAGGAVCSVGQRMTGGGSARLFGRACPHCGFELPLGSSIPLISWMAQEGACPSCGRPLGFAYPACELLGAGVFTSVVLRYGISLQTLELLSLACVLMTVAVTSLADYSIRNSCILAAILIRLAYFAGLFALDRPVAQLFVSSVVGAIALGVPLALAVFLSNAMLARDVNGMGTVKLVAVVGFYLGWQQGMLSLVLAVVIGVLVWIASPAKTLPVEVAGGMPDPNDPAAAEPLPSPRTLKATMEEDIAEPMRIIPFAPSIVIACWVMLLLGVSVAAWNLPII